MSIEVYDGDEGVVRPKRNSSKRVNKQTNGGKVIKEKFVEERQKPTLKALNPKQQQYIELLNKKSLVIATGFAGTSKTYIPTVMASDLLLKNEIDKIYISRPAVSSSKSLGYFAGSVVEKMSHWLLPVLSTMIERMGRERVEIDIKHGAIQFVPLEVIKGMSFGKRTWVIVDEAEDITVDEAKNILTRQGGGTMVLAGDLQQSALKGHSGLAYIKNMVEKYPELEPTTGFVDFNHKDDIVRSAACKAWIIAFSKEEQGGK